MIEATLLNQVIKMATGNGPGPKTLIAGTLTAGYYGTISSTDFIDGAGIASLTGLSQGAVINNGIEWFKVSLDNKTLFFPRMSIRSSVSWIDLYDKGLIYGNGLVGATPTGDNPRAQDVIVTIKGYRFRVRLFRGASSMPATYTSSNNDPVASYGSEWNRIIYNLATNDPPSQQGPNWAAYTDSQLGMASGSNNGEWTWCQEDFSGNTTSRLVRGGYGSGSYYPDPIDSRTAYIGWRPVLELIP